MIVLKKGNIKTLFYDAKGNLISFNLSRPFNDSIETSEFKFLDFFIIHFRDVELKPMRSIDEFCKQVMKEYLYMVHASDGGFRYLQKAIMEKDSNAGF